MRRFGLLLGVACLGVLAPRPASAHFYTDYPDAGYYAGPSPVPWWNEDSLGSPQKLGPCGDEDDATDAGGGPTYVVTPYQAGQTITLQWTEVISHTGWFRIAIAADRSTFVDPPVQVDSSGNSADAGIESPPVLPVLADGIYPHAIGGLKTWPPYALTLPTTPCEKCTIQLIQVMLDHPSNLGNLPDGAPNPDGFLYHHCIDISIAGPSGSDGGTTFDSGAGPGPGSSDSGSSLGSNVDSGSSGSSGGSIGGGAASSSSPSSGGCGCTLGTASPFAGGVASLFAIAVLWRRRKRSDS
jgi:MYXO-CTERM domain-containing protein